MTRIVELFEGDNSQLSMTRLLCFMSFFPASAVVLYEHSENTLGWYLGAYVLGYVGGKTADVFMKDKPPQDTNVTINQPDAVNVAGDVKTKGRRK